MASKCFLHTITELCWLAFSPVVVKKRRRTAAPVLKWLPKCYSSAHQSSREKIHPFFQHILLKDINSLSPLANPCFSFYFCQLHLLQSFWTQSLKEWKWFPNSTLILNICPTFLCFAVLFCFDQYNVLIDSTEAPFLRRLLWVCQHIDCCSNWSWNHSKPAWIPEATYLHYHCVLYGAIGINK